MDVDNNGPDRPAPSPLPRIPADVDRDTLLVRLGNALNMRAVPASFWACLQVADLSSLRTFIQEAEAAPRLCGMVSETLYALPRMWCQEPPKDQSSSCSSPSRSSVSDDVPRSRSAREIANERDGGKCVITGRGNVQACHIFPYGLLKKKKPTELTRLIPDIWKMLSLFFDNDDVNQWKNAVIPDPNKPTDSIPQFLICLSSNVREGWAEGYCAFKPLRVSSDCRELECEFHWLLREGHGLTDNMDLLKRPSSTAGLSESGGRFSHTFEGHRIESGYRLVLKTTNPETHPLPSFTPLQMSWKLTRIQDLSAAADEDPDLDDDDESETYNRELIEKWMAEVSDDDDNEVSLQESIPRDLESFLGGQSPLKTRTVTDVQAPAQEPAEISHDV